MFRLRAERLQNGGQRKACQNFSRRFSLPLCGGTGTITENNLYSSTARLYERFQGRLVLSWRSAPPDVRPFGSFSTKQLGGTRAPEAFHNALGMILTVIRQQPSSESSKIGRWRSKEK